MIFLDTETCGYHGPIVLMQWAKDDGNINLHSVWTEPIYTTLELIEEICNHKEGICGFNLAFDWFHICQTYTVLRLLPKDAIPRDCINDYALKEPEGRLGPCLKPVTALDLMLHARKGPYQTTMDRKDIRIKRVPTALVFHVATELDKRIPLKDIYFARKSDVTQRWQVEDIKDDFGDVVPEFKDIVLRFAPSSALKALAADALNIDTEEIKLFTNIDLPNAAKPKEYGFAPYALAVGNPDNWNDAWPGPGKIKIHISHWAYNSLARQYAEDDVKYTRMLYEYFGCPKSGDDDSILACMVGASRWRGYKIDVDAIKALKDKALKQLDVPINFNSPAVCKNYLREVMTETERLVVRSSTKANILEDISKWHNSTVCDNCNGAGCSKCEDGLIKSEELHPAAKRAKEIINFRTLKKEIEVYDKLLIAGRFHASFIIIGTFTSRMSGADGLNPQGIKRQEEVRRCFPLADGGLVLCGGDFDSFEVCLADSVYGDPKLREDLMSGKKIHGLFGAALFPDKTYEEILATKGVSGAEGLYTRAKNGVFALLYGGESHTLQTRVGITEQAADDGYQRWVNRYKVWGRERQKYFDMFCSMRQPEGIGTAVEWHEPADYIESMFGHRRYFTLENTICKTLFELANEPPKEWTRIKLRVTRRDREQTASGAVRSALFASAFAIQAANMRAAANHVIQSSGAQITKGLQCCLWALQPSGIHIWLVQPLNIHDEIMNPTKPTLINDQEALIKDFLIRISKKVPLIEMDWKNNIPTWGDK